ncbi:hypothetical protein VN12_08470 [Pirellula sp. SH-Sr6A]|uniref:restriction endonuclease n=1 Tax=Pirellula sp. SH-Sr6A TaxID=1632865 RepID=UPI00078D3801|nr:restriction endonuclease [Pirellula sp. SH-Sr6A]AMV32143.1 hypothetical protein VN12_08470 [Pirellula sp. SH-Sr6A]
MAADPLIYCLENLTDYDQFERLCDDMMALDGYRNIEPIGGSKDKGRDAIHVDSSTGTVAIFAYSVREDWRKKLGQDSEKIRKHGHPCNRLVFLSTAVFTPSERDEAVQFIQDTYGWPLELYGLERLSSMLRSSHRELVSQHPQIFTPLFFPFAGGLSLSPSPDHLVVDHVEADAGLAHWLSRRLTLAGFHVWCRGLAPMAGSSVNDAVRGLLTQRAFRYIPILSPEALSDPEFTARRNMALAVGGSRGSQFLIPAIAKPFDSARLDQETRSITAASFHVSWALGLKSIEEALSSTACPRKSEGARDLAIRSYFPGEIIINEPEDLASNLFKVTHVPEVIRRFHSSTPITDEDGPLAGQWSFRKVSPTHFLSFHYPPAELTVDHGITQKGGSIWRATPEMDGIRIDNLLIELIKKSLYAESRRRGLNYCTDRRLVYFPPRLLRNDNLSFQRLDGSHTHFSVVGERSHGWGDRASKYRYHIAPVFAASGDPSKGFEIIVRIRAHITDLSGKQFPRRGGLIRRKKLCKSWWNEEWLNRVMGVMQFLADGKDGIEIGSTTDDILRVERTPRVWSAPIRINEDALKDAKAIAEEEFITGNDIEENEDDDAYADA